MSDLYIFLFGMVVTVFVGAGLSTLIVWKNRAHEQVDGAAQQAPAPVGDLPSHS